MPTATPQPGRPSFFTPNDNSVSNRDELYFQSDYAFTHHLTGLVGFRYENERGSFVDSDFFENEKIQRTNFEYTLQFQGDIKNRLFYSAGGAIEKNHLYPSIAGTPAHRPRLHPCSRRQPQLPRHQAPRQRRHWRAGALTRPAVQQPLHGNTQ